MIMGRKRRDPGRSSLGVNVDQISLWICKALKFRKDCDA